MRRVVFKVLRIGSRLVLRPSRKYYKRYLTLITKRAYHNWAVQNSGECFVSIETVDSPLISVVVPAYNTDPTHLREMVYSVINQHYENWELIIVNASNQSESHDAINELQNIDDRIKVIDPGSNKGISGNTNVGINATKGQFIAFLDHDDIIHTCALHSMINEVLREKADMIYSDEDKVTHNGDYFFNPLCKPDWSPHLFENVNYINHFTIVRSELVRRVRGLRSECDGAQDYDFLLRLIDECRPRIIHIPRVLYHWRAAQSSTASDINTKKYIFSSGERALTDHFERCNIKAKPRSIDNKPGFYKTTYYKSSGINILIQDVEVSVQPKCASWLKKLFLEAPSKSNLHLVIGEWFKPYANILIDNLQISYLNSDNKNINNLLKEPVTLVFSEALMPHSFSSLLELAAVAEQSEVFAVQPIVVGRDNTIIDAGFVESEYGYQALFKGYKLGESTFFGNTDWVRDIAKISGKMFAIKTNNLKKILTEGTQAHPPLTFPPNQGHLLWPHSSMVYLSSLSRSVATYQTNYFNPQLSQAMYEIRIKTPTWQEQDRINE